jgi:hypothetical protein
VASRTLTIVLCQTREGNYTFSSLKDNVLSPLRSDLAFCGSAEESANDEILSSSKYVWNFSEPDDWAKACDEISSNDSNWRDLCFFGDTFLGGAGFAETKGSGLIIMYWREILRRSITPDILDSYEWFVITRSDFQWVVPHPKVELLDEEEIYLLDGEKYGGISDRHIIFHRNLASQIFDIATPIFHQSQELILEFSDQKINDLNPERFLFMMLERKGLARRIRYLPYLGFSVRHLETKTRWSQGVYNKKLDLYIKYPTEFRDAYRAKFAINSDKDWNTILNKRFHLRLSIIRLMQTTNSPESYLMKVFKLFCMAIDKMLQR